MTGIDLGAYYNNTTGEFDLEAFNATHGSNMTTCLNFTGDGPPPNIISYSSTQEQNALNAQEGKTAANSAGMIALYVIAGLAVTALIAFVVVRRKRNDKEAEGYDYDDRDYCPPDSIVVCERGGQVENLETVSVVAGGHHSGGRGSGRRKSRSGSASYIDFTGNVHKNQEV